MNDSMISDSIWKMSDYLSRYYGKKAIIMEFKVISTKKEKSLEETAQNALKQIKKGKKTINSKLTQFNVQSATATQKMNDGEIKLAQGEAQLNSSQQQLDSSKEQAKEAANIKNKLTVANVKALLTAQNFEMPAGYISEGNTQYLVRVGDKVTNPSLIHISEPTRH